MPQNLPIPHAGQELAGRIFRPPGAPKAGVVIAHGLYSSMQSAKLNRLAETLAQAGYLGLMFDALGCGASPGQVRLTTLSSRRDQMLDAVQALARAAPGLPLAYMGSSLGGTAALLAGGIRPPRCLLCWSTPVDLTALMRRLTAQPQPPDLPEMARDIPRHDLPALLAASPPLLVVHGQEDEVVPVEQAHLAHRLAAEPKDLLILPGADHRLSRPEDQARAMARSLAWLERFIS